MGENEEARLYGDLAGRRIRCVKALSQNFDFRSFSPKREKEEGGRKSTNEEEGEGFISSSGLQKDSSLHPSSFPSSSSSSLLLSRAAETSEEKEVKTEKKEEEDRFLFDFCIVLSVHSHAPLEEFFRRMQRVFDEKKISRYGYLCVTLPCCGETLSSSHQEKISSLSFQILLSRRLVKKRDYTPRLLFA